MNFKLEPIESEMDIMAESRYCIDWRLANEESIKKSSKLSRMNMSDSLDLIKREKIYGNFIPIIAKLSPQLFNSGKVQLNRRYSTPREYRRASPVSNENMYDQLSQHFRTRNQHKAKVIQNMGMDAFWTVRRQKFEEATRQKKKKKKNHKSSLDGNSFSVNRVESAYLQIMAWANLPQDTNGSLPRGVLKNYIANRTSNDRFSVRFLKFYEFKSFTSYREFCTFGQHLKAINLRLSNLISFMLYDLNDDGFICQSDCFKLFVGELSKRIEPDLMQIGTFIKSEPAYDLDTLQEQYKIEILILKDTLLTIKDYEMFFKKVDEPYMKAKSKKDTIFAKSFIVLDHREKIRSTRKQMQIKKQLYNELIGEILGIKTKDVLLRADRFRLDFGLFSSIFRQKTRFFRYFCEAVFGVV